jgi:hypothetical protein
MITVCQMTFEPSNRIEAPVQGGGSAAPRSKPPCTGASTVSTPKYDRVEAAGKVAILVNDGTGWTALTPKGVLINPWTKVPFQTLRHAKKLARHYLRKGWFPQPKQEATAT